MDKGQKISYKTYHNKQLKKVLFHGKEMHPLYLQLIYARKPNYFKSYYFDFYGQEKFAIEMAGIKSVPSIDMVIEKEIALINFIIDKHRDNFSHELFQEKYERYAPDLLSLLEDEFYQYLHTFFYDEGLPALAAVCKMVTGRQVAGLVMEDLKTALKQELYDRLLLHAVYYAPPYLPLFDFAKKATGDAVPVLTIANLLEPTTQGTFRQFLGTYKPVYDPEKVFSEIITKIGGRNV